MKNDLFLTASEERALRRACKGKTINREVAERLTACGLLECKMRPSTDNIFQYEITADGRRYIAARNWDLQELRWSRWISIIAILISLFTLLMELEDRGYLRIFKPAQISVMQATQEQAEAQ